MKYILIFLLTLFSFSCRCPECEALPPVLRLSFFNNEGVNLLDPHSPDKIEIKSFENIKGKKIDFIIKDYIIQGYSEGIYHFELRDNRRDSFFQNCLKEESKYLLKFKNNDIDTLDIKIDEIEERRCCSYWTMSVIYNGINMTQADTIVGALIIVK